MKSARLLPLASLVLVAPALAQEVPEGTPLPRNLTPAEAALLARNPIVSTKMVTPPPVGPIHCAAEYEQIGRASCRERV